MDACGARVDSPQARLARREVGGALGLGGARALNRTAKDMQTMGEAGPL